MLRHFAKSRLTSTTQSMKGPPAARVFVRPLLLYGKHQAVNRYVRECVRKSCLREIQIDLGPPTHVHGLHVLGVRYFYTRAIEDSSETAYNIGVDRAGAIVASRC